MKLRLGTRGSALARLQSADVARRLEAHGHDVETIIISTVGDRIADRGFSEVGTFGVFVREIETALLEGRVDLAVHSYKDLPSRGPDGLVVAAVPERLDAADVLLARRSAMDSGAGDIPLCQGASVGTAAARRRALLSSTRPDLTIKLLRGNVPTRVRALIDGRFDAIVLAAAGLERLQRVEGESAPLVPSEIVRTRLDPWSFVPAPAQGAIAVQVWADAVAVRDAVARLDDPRTRRTLAAERALLRLAEAGCAQPFGAWCTQIGAGIGLTLIAVLGLEDGSVARVEVTGDDPEALAAVAWRQLGNAVPA